MDWAKPMLDLGYQLVAWLDVPMILMANELLESMKALLRVDSKLALQFSEQW